jgi:AraC-type transcriptional regulator N-terminus
VIAADVPATGHIGHSPNGQLYLSVGLRLNLDALADLLGQLPDDPHAREGSGFSACAATAEFVDAWLRMLRLLKRPAEIPALAPAYEREIL